jgi:uncharacterized sulfatase
VEGHSLHPLVEDPEADWEHAAFSQVTRPAAAGANKKKDQGQMMGRSVRTERWRYTEWDQGRAGAELYDHDNDPREMKNLANDAGQLETVERMQALLRAGGK